MANGDDAEALAAAIEEARRLPRPVPRRRVEARFTLERMLDGYERLYRECIDGARAGVQCAAGERRVAARGAVHRPSTEPTPA